MDHARRRPAGPTPATPEHAAAPDRFAAILDLQRTAGNAVLTQLLSAAGPQRQATDRLTEPTLEPVTEPGEASEEEASAAVDPATKPILRYGSRGDSVVTIAFQESHGLVPDGIIGPLTWGELLKPPPGPALFSLGDEGDDVVEFQQKLNIVRLGAGLDPIAEDGAWGSAVTDATIAYQASKVIPESGNGDRLTWHHLDIDAPVTTVGFVDRQWLLQQGGLQTGKTGATAKYSWRIAGNQILCSAKIDFRNNPPSPDWAGFVTAAWNIYKAVSDTGDEVDIDFQIVQGTGGDANVVNVNTGTGRANAGNWFLTDDKASATIPHEFGQLIGLRDEYQVHPGDYREITGNEPPVGDSDAPADGATPEQVAQEVQDAIVAHDDRAGHDATVGRGIKMGVPPPNSALGYEMIQVLTYSSGSMMGDRSRVTDPHDHGVQPRHVQEFADLVAAARGGSWRIEPR